MGFGIFIILTSALAWGLSYALAGSSALIKAMLFIPFGIFALIGLYVVLAFFNIKYVITDTALEITWGLFRKVIPWTSIKTIEKVEGMPKVWGVFGASWPGYYAGVFNITGMGVMSIFGTQLEDHLVVIRTEKGVFGITPVLGQCFLDIIQRKAHLVARITDLDENEESLLQPIPGEDNIYLALAGLNILCLLALVAYMVAFFPSAVLAAAALGTMPPPRELILLPVIALAVFLISLSSAPKMYQNAPAGGYIMWGLGIIISLSFLTLSVYILGLG